MFGIAHHWHVEGRCECFAGTAADQTPLPAPRRTVPAANETALDEVDVAETCGFCCVACCSLLVTLWSKRIVPGNDGLLS